MAMEQPSPRQRETGKVEGFAVRLLSDVRSWSLTLCLSFSKEAQRAQSGANVRSPAEKKAQFHSPNQT